MSERFSQEEFRLISKCKDGKHAKEEIVREDEHFERDLTMKARPSAFLDLRVDKNIPQTAFIRNRHSLHVTESEGDDTDSWSGI